jgi:hypothetical protein
LLVILAGLLTGLLASRGLNRFLEVEYIEKDFTALAHPGAAPDTGFNPMPLRIVDLGGVGVLPDTANWGNNYEHNQHQFEDVLLVHPPFIDPQAYSRERQKFSEYASKMGGFGYNAIALPWFMELVNFEKVENGQQVYENGSLYRMRHDSMAGCMAELMELADREGLGTYLLSDMVALTPPLKHYFEERFGTLDTENPEFWEVYGKAAEEAFERFPWVEGMIIRIGEAGSVYNKPGWDYTSELLVTTEKGVRGMLEAFLGAAEKYDRTIIFRSWSVGVGNIGDMHTNPETYQRVLSGIESGHLVVSTKYCSGDFYSWLPLNPTLFQGGQRRITEIQAKREFEGLGALPNYLGPLHQRALQALLRENPKIEGVWVWTQNGGPLRAGPLVIYPFYGFNVINDVNVYAASRIMMDPYADLDSITAAWIRGYFGSDTLLVARLTEFLNTSYEVMLSGLYISEFAKYQVKALGLEPPPMLWIFEWDILGGSSAVFSNIYYITRDHFREVVEEGTQAVMGVGRMKEMLLEVSDRVTLNRDDFDLLVTSVDYEAELFRLLGHFRQFFMNYYRWIDTGDRHAAANYKVAMGQFKAVARFHEEKFSRNLNTLGMDLGEALSGIRIAENTGMSIRWARVVVVITLFLLLMGIPGFVRNRARMKFAGTLYFDAIFRPARISTLQAYHGTRRFVVFLLTLYLLFFVIFSSFTSLLFPVCMGLLGLLYILLFSFLISDRRDLDRVLVTVLAPRMMILSFVLLIVAVRGPGYFWYQFWVSDLFRMLFFSVYIMLLLRKFHIYIILGRRWGDRPFTASLARVLMSLGVQVMVAGLALWLFGLEGSLTALNNQLLILPGGLSKILGITTHLGIPPELPIWIVLSGSALLLVSAALLIVSGRRGKRGRTVLV